MIGKLRGFVDIVGEDYAIIDVNGVGYTIFASSGTLRMLENIASTKGVVSLHIETHVREDHIHLYAFPTRTEQNWFNLLMTVQGVGAKMALSIMDCFSCDELVNIIGAQETALLTRANGVGKKIAERIITELKSKVAKMPISAVEDIVGDDRGLAGGHHHGQLSEGGASHPSERQYSSAAAAEGSRGGDTVVSDVASLREDAISALVNLGYNRADVFSVVARIIRSDTTIELSEVIRIGLRELS